MADGLTIPVNAPGLEQSAAGFDRLDRSATRAAGSMTQTGTAMARLTQIASRGEFVRNASASFALLTMSSGNATERIMSLTAALSSVPGPIGAVATAGTLLLGVFNAMNRSSAEAEKRVQALRDSLAALEKQRGATEGQIAGRLSSSALQVGDEVRRFRASGGMAMERGQLQSLMPGNAGGALRGASELAVSGLDQTERQRVLDVLATGRRAGATIDDKAVISAIDIVRQAAKNYRPLSPDEQAQSRFARSVYEARGGGGFAGGGIRQPTDTRTLTSDTLDFLEATGTYRKREDASDALNRSGRAMATFAQRSLAIAEAPAVAEANARFREAAAGGMTEVGQEALRNAVLQNKGSVDELTRTLKELTGQIKDTNRELEDAKPKAAAGWSWSFPWSN